MKTLQKQLVKRGFNAELSMDGINVYDLIDDDYILIELSEDGYIYLATENFTIRVENNLNDIIDGLIDLMD